jgi:hypothetical protein
MCQRRETDEDKVISISTMSPGVDVWPRKQRGAKQNSCKTQLSASTQTLNSPLTSKSSATNLYTNRHEPNVMQV